MRAPPDGVNPVAVQWQAEEQSDPKLRDDFLDCGLPTRKRKKTPRTGTSRSVENREPDPAAVVSLPEP
jgi:hypothetical protein